MAFDVSADAYGRFMGRFSEPLADEFVALVRPPRGSGSPTSGVARGR